MYTGYRPSLTGPFQKAGTQALPTTFQDGPQLSGNGSPEGVVPGVPGQQYVNLLNQDLYLKLAGTQAVGWKLVGKATAGVVIFRGSGNPNNVVTATSPAFFYTATGSVWMKIDSGSSNTGWEQIIGEQ